MDSTETGSEAEPASTDEMEKLSAGDFLTEVTRRSRGRLLWTSLLSIAIVFGGLVPTEIPILGVEVRADQQTNLLFLLAAAIGYLIISFCVYARVDLQVWQIQKQEVLSRNYVKVERFSEVIDEAVNRDGVEVGHLGPWFDFRPNWLTFSGNHRLVGMLNAKIMIDLYFPLLLGSFSLGMLLHSTRGFRFGLHLACAMILLAIVLSVPWLYRVLGLWKEESANRALKKVDEIDRAFKSRFKCENIKGALSEADEESKEKYLSEVNVLEEKINAVADFEKRRLDLAVSFGAVELGVFLFLCVHFHLLVNS